MDSVSDERKIALVTGASGGLGKFVIQALMETDAQIAAIERHPQQRTADSRYFSVAADLADVGATEKAVRAIVTRFGRIDALLHLVGGFEGGTSVIETEEAALDRMLDLNLRSAFRIIRAVAPHMQSRRSGRIVAIASRTAVEPQGLLGAYAASKAALVALMRSLALELKVSGVTANVVLPGTMDTPANRAAMPSADKSTWVHPEHVAKVILWLASDDAGEITGASIPVYGAGA